MCSRESLLVHYGAPQTPLKALSSNPRKRRLGSAGLSSHSRPATLAGPWPLQLLRYRPGDPCTARATKRLRRQDAVGLARHRTAKVLHGWPNGGADRKLVVIIRRQTHAR